MDRSVYDHEIDMCVKGRSSAGFMAGYFEKDDTTCSSLSDSIVRQNKDPIHMQIAAWYGRQDCDQWSDTRRCILGTLRPLIDYQGTFAPVQDIVAKAREYCKGTLDDGAGSTCNIAAKYFLNHGEPLVADAILQNTCNSWIASHGNGGYLNCNDVGAPEEVARRKKEAELRQQERDAQEAEAHRQQIEAERAEQAARAQWLQSPEGQQWQAQQAQQQAARAQWLQSPEGQQWQAEQAAASVRAIQRDSAVRACKMSCLDAVNACSTTCGQTYNYGSHDTSCWNGCEIRKNQCLGNCDLQ
jgi:hypothetical protein